MRPALNLCDTAAAVGKAPETWRKGWKHYVRTLGFPAPLPGRRHFWRPEEIEAWIERRDKALGLGNGRRAPLPANDGDLCDNPLRGLSPARLHRERAELAQMMKG